MWFYRRGNAWLFAELAVIVVASWFLVNETWTSSYRISKVPDGIDAEDVFCVKLGILSPGRTGYDAGAASYERLAEDYARMGDALRAMPEVLAAAPMSSCHPLSGGGMSMMSLTVDSLTYMNPVVFNRGSGSDDFSVFRYEVIWPRDGKIDDAPGSILITEDLAEFLFHGENPVGRTVGEACSEDIDGWNQRIAGVIGSLRVSGCQDNVPYVVENTPESEMWSESMYSLRLKPGTDAGKFLEKAQEEWRRDLVFGNWRVTDVYSMEEGIKSAVRSEVLDSQFVWRALWVFMVFNVLLAVASVGWLRMEERMEETGIRRAMGGSGIRILFQYAAEMWLVFAAAAIVGTTVTVNILLLGKISIVNPENNLGMVPLNSADFPLLFDPVPHFLAVEGIVLGLLFLAVTVAIILPVAGALRKSPTDALRAE